jgi:uroporphyrinogen-III decarboxylase
MEGVPDRVPVYAQMHEFVMRELDLNAREFYTKPEVLVTGTLDVSEKYGIDVAFLDFDVYNIEAEGLGQRMIYGDRGMPDVDRSQPLIRDRSDLKKIKTPQFDSVGRFPHVVEMYRIFKNLTGTGCTPEFTAPFSLAANIRGIEQLLSDLHDDPDFARTLFDRLTDEVLVPWLDHLKRMLPGETAFSGNDATASLPIVSPMILREWVVPCILRLRESSGAEVYVPNWVGERYMKNPGEMLDLKLNVCPGFLEGQDPDVEVLGPAVYKEHAEKYGVPLILGVGASFLALSSPSGVRERVRRYIETGGRNGRFALYLCNLGATTPPDNVRAAVDAVREYGVYE